MADVSVKMGVSGISQFKQGMKDAQSSVKTLNEALKLNENQLKLNGDKEQYLQNKTALLKKAITEQTNAVKQGAAALQAMTKNGVDPASKAYQDMERSVYKAQNELVDLQVQLQQVGDESQNTAEKTDQLANSLGGLNKKVSLEQVIGGIDKITTGLENAGKKAVQLGETIWTNVMDAAKWADDSMTMALMYGVDMDTYLRVEKLVQNGLDTSVDAILKSQQKLKKGIGSGSDSIMQTMKELGLTMQMVNIYGEHFEQLATYDPTEMFWRAGQAIMELGDEYEQEAKAQELFGKSWRELIPLFTQYHSQEEFSKALEDVNVVSEEEVSVLADLNDKVSELKGNFDTLETKVMAGLAPALTAGAEAISTLLDKVLKYLDTPKGQQMLDDLSTAVSGLFTDLSNIDPEKVVKGFTGVFDKIVGGLQWLTDNKAAVIGAMEGIVTGWGVLKLTGGALNILRLIDGLKWLKGGGASIGAASGGTEQAAAGGAEGSTSAWFGNLFNNLVSGMAAKSVLDVTDKLTHSMDDIDTSGGMTEQAVVEWVDKQIANGFIQAKDRDKAISDNVFLLNLDEKAATFGSASGHDFTVEDEPLIMIDPVHLMDLEERMGQIFKDSRKPFQPIDLNEEETAALFENLVLPAEIEVPEDEAEKIAEDVGTVLIPGRVIVEDVSDEEMEALFGSHANGLWSVPFDGYMAMLHKGERVMPAREVASRSFSSNLYVESMYMNNGTDANGLASAMAAAQKREMAGFGS